MRQELKLALRLDTPQAIDYLRGVVWRVRQRGGLTAAEYIRAMGRLLVAEVRLQRAAACN
jgi:hypothetical protein